MGHKIFISYKYADSDVKNITGHYWPVDTVRNYVDELENKLAINNQIYKGESDGEDLSYLSEVTIWNKLRDRIYDSTLTIVLISKNMKDIYKLEENQWIPREISFSLKETSRKNINGDAVTSKTNAMLAVVIPDRNNSCSYFTYPIRCDSCSCTRFETDKLFSILRKNMFNQVNPDSKNCTNGSTVYNGDYHYISVVEWDKFILDMGFYIERAYSIQNKIEEYNIYKEID